MSTPLTRYPAGSLRQVAAISLPLMLAALSGSLMLFVDRLFLAQFSPSAMNAAVAMGMTAALFQFGAVSLVSIAEVFVGRFHGARNYRRCGEPAHQMLYFSLMTAAVFLPLAWFCPPLLVPKFLYADGGHHYFRILMLFGPLFPAAATLSAYFIGLGRVRTVAIAMIVGNAVNIGLDLLLIFGWPPLIPPLGCAGAAIATGFAELTSFLILGACFLSHQQQCKFGTARCVFRPALFWECLRVGTPAAAGHMMEIACWTIGIQMVTHAGPQHLAVYALGQSFFVLFGFTSEGLQKGVATLVANYLGADKIEIARKATLSGLKLVLALSLALTVPLLLFPEQLTLLFLNFSDPYGVLEYARLTCFCLWLFFIADSTAWVLAAALTAGGDTKFVMWMNGVTALTLSALPAYFAYFVFHLSPAIVWVFVLFYASVNSAGLYLRYRKGVWQKLVITPASY